MIRLFREICKAFNEKSLDNDLNRFEEYISNVNVKKLSCPYCKRKGGLTYFASYSRHLITYEGGKVIDHIIQIPRYICPSCGRTHAILPPTVIPYKSFSFGFLIHLIRDHLRGKFSSIHKLCKHYEISISTFYRILDNFKEQKKLWLGLLKDRTVEELDFVQDIMHGSFTKLEGFIKDFFTRFSISFFQGTS